ncbi:TspO/MBR family protein [Methylocapsa palsarum]|uniref:Tryptophan-rich sensory protein n=1 Tax=Methylocapsa palsarum TaxID=1612308 RepID=A0A1I3VUQ0_9HYPH|nr:TspO/MBR family protein [Methylocapsa palsarum]SFJ98037.1 tryptophan-rich sensory protein [Methylocapsa palsarum]
METSDAAGLFVFAAACFGAASSGALFRPGKWYANIRKPWWTPPDWLFGPVWSILYVMIAISGWLVWRRAGLAGAAAPLAIYGAQLLLNAGWSGLFFGLRRLDLAFAEIVVLWLSIAATIVAFDGVDHRAALLLAPYFVWVSFASALNFALWRLNPSPVSRELA